MIEEKASSGLREIESESFSRILELLRNHESEILVNIEKVVSSLCDIDCDKMMGGSTTYYSAQCRWLYWYTYRYMTNEPYNKMSKRLGKHGHEYTPSAITIGVNRMAQMVESDTVWKKRWIILKRIIKAYDETNVTSVRSNEEPVRVKVVITKPRNVDIKVEFKNE